MPPLELRPCLSSRPAPPCPSGIKPLLQFGCQLIVCHCRHIVQWSRWNSQVKGQTIVKLYLFVEQHNRLRWIHSKRRQNTLGRRLQFGRYPCPNHFCSCSLHNPSLQICSNIVAYTGNECNRQMNVWTIFPCLTRQKSMSLVKKEIIDIAIYLVNRISSRLIAITHTT